MIELAEMAQFVNDDVIGLMGREEGQAVAEVEVAFGGAAAPAGLLIADGDFVIRESVELIKILQPLMDQLPRRFLVLQIIFPIPLAPDHSPSAPACADRPHNPEFKMPDHCLSLYLRN